MIGKEYTGTKTCPHRNGWYETVQFWIFEKKVFVCTDCRRLVAQRVSRNRK